MRLKEIDLALNRNDSAILVVGPITRPDVVVGDDVPVDLTSPGLQAWITVKRDFADLDNAALVQVTELSGISLNAPSTADKNYLTAILPAGSFAALTEDTILYWDCQIKSGGQVETVARGTLNVELDVTLAT